MKEKQSFEALVAVIGALWVSVNTVIASSQIINERRDVVITGVLNGVVISTAHRLEILQNDWLPMVIASFIICVVFAFFLLIVPRALGLGLGMAAVCWLSAAVPSVGAVSWAIDGFREYGTLKALINSNVRANHTSVPPA